MLQNRRLFDTCSSGRAPTQGAVELAVMSPSRVWCASKVDEHPAAAQGVCKFSCTTREMCVIPVAMHQTGHQHDCVMIDHTDVSLNAMPQKFFFVKLP